MRSGQQTADQQTAGPAVWFGMAGLLILVAVPIAFVILQAVFPELGRGSFARPFGQVAAVLGDPALLRLTRNTLLLGVCVVALAAIIAVPLGFLRALYAVPLAPLWDVLFLVPFMVPPYIATLGWIMTLQPRGYLAQLTSLHAGPFLFSFAGLVFVMALNLFPAIYFAVSRTAVAIGSRYADVGRVCGAGPWTAFRRITLPLATPALVASALLVFALTIEEYGTPAALGRQSGYLVLVTAIETRTADWPVDLPGAAILSLILVLLSVGAFALQLKILAGRSFETTGGKPQAFVPAPLGAMALPVLIGFTLIALLATGVPLFAILATALSRTISGGLSPGNLGFENFEALLSLESGGLRALGNSLALGLATALLTGFIGAMVAYAVVKTRFRGKAVFDALSMLPNALPGVVVAVGLILAWNRPLPLSPYNTPFILLLAYSCILLPYPIRYANAALRQINDNLEAAARVSGASSLTSLRRIVLPLIWPSLLSAMLLVFAVASRELVASVLVAPVGMMTVATFIWRQFEQGSIGLGMAMSTIALIVTLSVPLAITALTRGMGGIAR
ncbi:iron ABC transporter permease [Starkeya sp. ORNL1]|uniref:ABC transporter permease n=1 Tax=Starkeya sp. ORNL1 TaxID=2709380 RepID=UPI0014628963|nr:iron ABC transporter permease [Starkeya sp. ORNL1]QJP13097.1 iron ABC transporter permease [Starkeya sp. ORNL1]